MEWYVIVNLVLLILWIIYSLYLSKKVYELKIYKTKYKDELYKNEQLNKKYNYIKENHKDIYEETEKETQIVNLCGLEFEKHILEKYDTLEGWGYYHPRYINHNNKIEDYTTEQLQQELEERKLKQNYPLAYEIKHLDCEFVELYEDGKFKDKYTKDYAWEYVKKYGKDKNIVYKAIK